ncbi:MAG: dTDP-4-dehydrorhamnose reductase [Thermodesulfovibrionales bacterium]|nr:dTDP-4-dehydrorhamnose reductase [Thermodesulfovibrionales bacterium]
MRHHKILITGKRGQLATAFEERLSKEGIDYVALSRSECDITGFETLKDIVSSIRPTVIINCAAYNLVDKAEVEKDMAFAVNAIGPKNLSILSSKHACKLIHYSSDYVFDGNKETGLYTESDTTSPLSVYGLSKLEGERNALENCDDVLVFRTSWVFGKGVQNFVYKLLQWEKTNEYLKVACDEFSVPTYTDMIVTLTLKAIEQDIRGLFHLTSSGFCSRYEWARLVFEILGIKKHIHPVHMSIFNLPAKRPRFSAMSNDLLSKTLCIDIPHWSEGVRDLFINKISTYNY